MAYVKILPIKCRGDYLQSAVKYAVSPDKTIEERLGIAGDYALDSNKTELDEVRYASCLNISDIGHATQEMMDTKKKWNKLDKTQGYHVIQSFSPDDNITPEQAHEIGVQYAKELFGDYEVVIGTHVDRSHIHNHIVFNSVSCVDGKKFHAKKEHLRHLMRKTSDRYCKEKGLSVIHYTSTREMTRKEWYERHWREGTFKESINKDIRTAAAQSKSIAALLIRLENMGYKIDGARKHITVVPPDGRKAWRLDKFYTDEELQTMTEGGGMARIALRRNEYKNRTYSMVRGKRPPQKLTQFQYMYLQWMKLLGGQPRRTGYTYIPKGEYRKFNEYKKQIQFASNHNLRKLSQVISFREEHQGKLKRLNIEKYRLEGRKKRYAKLFEAHKKVSRWSPIITKLDDETKEEYEAALVVLKKSGYAENLPGVETIRIDLETEILRNKNERVEVQNKIKMCRRIEAGAEKIKPIVKQEQKQKTAEREPERVRAKSEQKQEQKKEIER